MPDTGELREQTKNVAPLLGQAKDTAEIRARVERIESKISSAVTAFGCEVTSGFILDSVNMVNSD